jgi:hypothetical protein
MKAIPDIAKPTKGLVMGSQQVRSGSHDPLRVMPIFTDYQRFLTSESREDIALFIH